MITKCIDRAYLDFNRTLLFKEEYKGDTKKKKNKRKKALSHLKDTIRISIVDLIDNKIDDYNKWHNQLCQALLEEAEKGNFLIEKEKEMPTQKSKVFYYGQAQKWVNMTIKYVWLLGLIPERFEKELHIPVDRYLIEALLPNCAVPTKNDSEIKPTAFQADKIVPWSEWNKINYNDFQSCCKQSNKEKNKLPLVWENRIWIETAAKYSLEEYFTESNEMETSDNP